MKLQREKRWQADSTLWEGDQITPSLKANPWEGQVVTRKPADWPIMRKSVLKSTGSPRWLERRVLSLLKKEYRSSQIIQRRLSKDRGRGDGETLTAPRSSVTRVALPARQVAVPSEPHCSGLPPKRASYLDAEWTGIASICPWDLSFSASKSGQCLPLTRWAPPPPPRVTGTLFTHSQSPSSPASSIQEHIKHNLLNFSLQMVYLNFRVRYFNVLFN